MLTACYPVGALYTGTNVPDSAIDRVEVGGPGKTDDKVGQACATGILGLIAWGDAAIDAAKRDGKITDVHVVDHKQTAVLFGAYYQACTVVHGK